MLMASLLVVEPFHIPTGIQGSSAQHRLWQTATMSEVAKTEDDQLELPDGLAVGPLEFELSHGVVEPEGMESKEEPLAEDESVGDGGEPSLCPDCGNGIGVGSNRPTSENGVLRVPVRTQHYKCEVCAKVVVLLNQMPKSEVDPMYINRGSLDWRVLTNAYLTLCYEGYDPITPPILKSRFQGLRALFAPIDRPASSASGASQASASMAAPIVRPPPATSAPASLTPQKRSSSDCPLSRCSAREDSLGGGLATTRTSSSAASPSANSASGLDVARGGVGGSSDSGGAMLDDGADDGDGDGSADDDLHPMTLGARIPTGMRAAGPLSRMRGTLNEYVYKLGAIDWYKNFRPATVNALARRLNGYAPDIRGSMDVELTTAFNQLQSRVRSLVSLHTHLKNWASSGLEMHLGMALKAKRKLAKVLNHFRLRWAPDLQLVFLKAQFSRCFKSSNSVAKVDYSGRGLRTAPLQQPSLFSKRV